MCVLIPFILDVRFVDVPAGVTLEEGHTGFLDLLSAVRKIQPFLSLVDRDVEFCILFNNELIVLHLLGIFISSFCEEKYQFMYVYIYMYGHHIYIGINQVRLPILLLVS